VSAKEAHNSVARPVKSSKPPLRLKNLFTAGGLKEATTGFEFKRVLKALEDAGALVKTGATQKSLSTRIPNGESKDLYWIDPGKLKPTTP
jgi:hypothetical protein